MVLKSLARSIWRRCKLQRKDTLACRGHYKSNSTNLTIDSEGIPVSSKNRWRLKIHALKSPFSRRLVKPYKRKPSQPKTNKSMLFPIKLSPNRLWNRFLTKVIFRGWLSRAGKRRRASRTLRDRQARWNNWLGVLERGWCAEVSSSCGRSRGD